MKILFMILLAVFFLLQTIFSSRSDFSDLDITFFTILVTFVFIIQSIICFLARGNRIIVNGLISFYSILNILSLNLVLNESFIILPVYLIAGAILLGFFITFTILRIMDDFRAVSKGLPLVFCAAIAVEILISSPVEILVSERTVGSHAENVALVDFNEKPNVYIVSFDSLVPKSIVNRYLGIESAAYHDVLDKHFKIFPNFFVDAVPTKYALNILLALDKAHYFSSMENGNQFKFFPGLIPSPLFEIFKHNGYRTSTIFNNYHFGNKKGPYVDNYFVNWKFSVCEFITSSLHTITLFGYCRLMNKLIDTDSFKPVLLKFGVGQKRYFDDYFIEKMRISLSEAVPQLFVAYIHSPGHTERTFDYESTSDLDQYRQSYLANSKSTAIIIRNLVNFLAKSDPDAIMYLFGDHGLLMSRRVTFDQDPSFFTIDRFAVFGGIYPASKCSESFARPYTQEFMTALQGANMIIRCLSGGKEALKLPAAYDLFGFGIEGKQRYEDFLYE